MDQKPVSYLALKSLLGHMEANRRIQTAIACPSLRKIEKTIPLRIDYLGFVSDYQVKINNNLYSFGVIRQNREGPPPEEIQSANDRGGLRCDLDKSGYERPSYRLTKTPGDICFGDGLDDDDEFGIWLEGRIPEHNEIDLNPAYDCFVQLNLRTGEFGQPSRPVQKVPYTKKLHEVIKDFMTFIFGGRTCPVQVSCLEIYSTTQIIRLPVGVKFSVHELGVPKEISSVSEVLRPILDESCFPIKHINQRAHIELNDPFVASAEEVTFEDHRGGNLFDFIRNLPHFKVNIFNCSRFNEEEFVEFLEYLLENDKKTGTTYQLAYDNERKYKNQEIASTFIRIDAGIMKREVIIDFLIQIVIACPSLQKVEKSIPLKIDRLDFVSNYKVQINNNLYGFGIVREYREGTAPEPFRSMNDRGGINCDLDEWGFEKPSYRLTETPGDINFGDVLEDNDEGNDVDMEREAQEFRDSHSGDVAAGSEFMSYWWMNIGYKLLPYRCRKNNVKPAHDCFVQLNLTTGVFRQPSRPVQKVPYTKKLNEVMKDFMTFIFGGRSCPVQVNCLEIYSATQIIRLPVGVKFSVHELRVLTKVSSISEVLLPVLDESSFPIKHINQEEPVDLNDSFVANAEEVTFHDGFNVKLFEFILSLPHLKINFFSKFYDLYNEEDFIKFIENLLQSDKKVKTTYQVGSGEDQRIMDTFSKIENGIMKREIIGDRDLIIQKEDGSSEVQITYMKDVKQMYFGRIESYCILRIQVLGNHQENID